MVLCGLYRVLGCRLDGAEVGVGLAVGDLLEVAVDVAGVALGLCAGGEFLAGEIKLCVVPEASLVPRPIPNGAGIPQKWSV